MRKGTVERFPGEGVVRQRLLSAMAWTVAERGYVNVKVEDVVERAGVTRTEFHQEFGDLEACFLALYRSSVEVILARMAEAFAAERDWRSGLRAAFATLFRTLTEHPEVTRACFSDLSFVGPSARRARDEALAQFAAFVGLCRAGAPCGTVAPLALDHALAGGLHHMVSARVRAGRISELPDLAAPIADTVYAHFQGAAPGALVEGPRVTKAAAPNVA